MAWTTPATFTTGNVLTAAQMNTNVRDNTKYLFDPPGCLATRTSNFSVSSGGASPQIITFTGTDVFDTDTMHDGAGAHPENITFNTAGIYLLTINIEFVANATGYRRVLMLDQVNNIMVGEVSSSAIGGSDNVILSASGIAKQAAATNVSAFVFQNSGGALNVLGTASGADGLSVAVPCYYGACWFGSGV